MSSHLTIARNGEAEIEVKRSRFRCTLVRVEDEPAARAVVEVLRKRALGRRPLGTRVPDEAPDH